MINLLSVLIRFNDDSCTVCKHQRAAGRLTDTPSLLKATPYGQMTHLSSDHLTNSAPSVEGCTLSLLTNAASSYDGLKKLLILECQLEAERSRCNQASVTEWERENTAPGPRLKRRREARSSGAPLCKRAAESVRHKETESKPPSDSHLSTYQEHFPNILNNVALSGEIGFQPGAEEMEPLWRRERNVFGMNSSFNPREQHPLCPQPSLRNCDITGSDLTRIIIIVLQFFPLQLKALRF